MILRRVRKSSDDSRQASFSEKGRGKVWIDIRDLIELIDNGDELQIKIIPR